MRPHPATQDITILTLTKTGVDGDGNAIRTPTPRVVSGLYAPGGSSENTDDQERVITTEQVVIPDPPADLVVKPTDQVQVASLPGVTFDVAGDVQFWSPGIVVPLKRVSG